MDYFLDWGFELDLAAVERLVDFEVVNFSGVTESRPIVIAFSSG